MCFDISRQPQGSGVSLEGSTVSVLQLGLGTRISSALSTSEFNVHPEATRTATASAIANIAVISCNPESESTSTPPDSAVAADLPKSIPGQFLSSETDKKKTEICSCFLTISDRVSSSIIFVHRKKSLSEI